MIGKLLNLYFLTILQENSNIFFNTFKMALLNNPKFCKNSWEPSVPITIGHENLKFEGSKSALPINPKVFSSFKPIYILKHQAFINDGNNYIDILFIDNSTNPDNITNKINILRIVNVRPEFYVLKFPKLTDNEFETLIFNHLQNNKINAETHIKYLNDSQFFTPYKNTYVQVITNNHFDAAKALEAIRTFAASYYSILDPSTLTAHELLIYKNSETPFRNISCISINNLPAFISTKYDIPQVGATILNMDVIDDCDHNDEDLLIDSPRYHIYRVQYDDIEKAFFTHSSTLKDSYFYSLFNIPFDKEGEKKMEKIYKDGIAQADKFTNNLKIIAYDIETYKPLTDTKWDKNNPKHEIITIGFSIFNLTDPKPIRRAAIIPRDFDLSEEVEVEENGVKTKTLLKNIIVQQKDSKTGELVDFVSTPLYKEYRFDDYGFRLPNSNSESKIDYSIYYTTQNEKDMLITFAMFIKHVQPFCVIGFNNWGFDDEWIQTKLKHYNIDISFLGTLFPYNINTFNKNNCAQCPNYSALQLKFDGEVQQKGKEKHSSWIQGLTSFYDAMYCQYKEDTKRFNEGQSKKLENMLKVYGIKSPYTESNANDVETLAKSGLSYYEMFVSWQNHRQTFKIAHYCLQDAWITGVFAIRKNMISDKMEMSNITHTSFYESIIRADNVRVGNTIKYYAHLEGFAIYDSPDTNSRAYRLNTIFSSKSYDKRTVIGGAVKNKRNGREMDIVAVDFSSMYPSQKEGSNTDTSSRIDSVIIEHPEEFGLKLIKKYYLEDMYTNRWFYVFQDMEYLKTTGKEKYFEVEEHFAEFKTNPKAIEKIKERYLTLKKWKNQLDIPNTDMKCHIENLYDRLKAELYPLYKDVKSMESIIKQVCPESVINKKIPFDNENSTVKDYKINSSFTLETIFDYILESPNKLKLPPTVKVSVYCVQSPKDEENFLPTIHYALKEKMLSDFRAKRKAVKKELANPRDATHKIQLEAKEKAIKVVMNSEYGQTGNEAFGWYDSDVAAAVTYASRHCIAECTTCLHTHHFYVDPSYYDDKNFQGLVKFCEKYGHPNDVRIEKIVYNPFELYSKIFDNHEIILSDEEIKKVIANEIELSKAKSKIIESQKDENNIDNQNQNQNQQINQNQQDSSQTHQSEIENDINNLTSDYSTERTIFDLIFEGSQRSRAEIQELKNSININTLTFNTDKYSIIDFILPPRRLTVCDVYTELRTDIEKQLINLGIDTSDMTKYVGKSFIDIYHQLKLPEVYLLTMPPSSVVYQDTDSNYYTNEVFAGYIPVRNPETTLEIMDTMILHNNLLSRIIPDIIKRPPIGVGFEGAFTVARYLNKKKKYYGKQWDENMKNWIEIKRTKDYLENSKLLEYELKHIVITPPPTPDPKNPDKMIKFKITPNEHGIIQEFSTISEIPFDLNSQIYIRYDYHHLPDDYEDYLIAPSGDKAGNYLCKYSTIPFKDGSYMKFTLSDAVSQNLLDFVHYFGIKCTGVDLARRDQFKFVNFNHLLTFKNDLRYTPDTNIDTQNLIYISQHSQNKPEKFKLWEPIHRLLLNFAGIELIRNKSDLKTKYEQNWLNWHIKDFQNSELGSVFYPWSELSPENILNYKDQLKKQFNEFIYSYKDYPLEFYSKIVRYDPAKKNGMVEIVDKLLTMINDASLDVNNVINKIQDIINKFSQKDTATNEFINAFNLGIFNSISSIYEIKIKVSAELERIVNEKQILSKYTLGFVNEITKLIENIDKVNLKSRLEAIVPHAGDRIPYVVISPNQNKLTITSSKGDDKYGDRKDKGYLLEQLRVLFTDDEIYELLDYKFYFNQLCKSLCNYLAIEYNPSIADYLSEEFEIEHPDMTPDEIKTEMDKKINDAIKAIMKDIVNRYYPEASMTEIKKRYKITKIENRLREITPKDYLDVNNLSEILIKNIPEIRINGAKKVRIENLETMIINDPLEAKRRLIVITNYLNNLSNRTILSLQSHKLINFDVEIINPLNELIAIYENMLSNITAYVESVSTRKSNEKLKVFIWLEDIKQYKNQDPRCNYKFEVKRLIDGDKKLKDKKVYSWIIPKWILETGGKIQYTNKLKEIFEQYFMIYDEDDLIRTGNGSFSFWKAHDKFLFKQIIILMNELSKS